MQTSKYEVLGIVGEGAYGVVYKCRNKENNEFVAIKKFKETEDEIVKKSMLRELKVLKILKHDNIVEFKEAFKRKNNLYLVFEYVEKTLLELLQEHAKGLDPNLIKKIIYQLCEAIKYLHGLNIIHRDIKPENLLIDKDNKLKLCDFGFARSINSKNKEQLTDYVATRWYRSPELLLGNGYYGQEMDYWAIGCIMGELADGDPLFPGENELDQIKCIVKILGKLPDEQIMSFNRNQGFAGEKLPDVTRPETLEKRYAGKLPKTAINFMKMLLNPDPNQRLKGEAVFQHPYFEGFKLEGSMSSLADQVNLSIPKQIEKKTLKSNNAYVNNSNSQFNIQVNEGGLTSKESIKGNSKLQQPPIISNTTNINIINYNYENEPTSLRSSNDFKKKEEINYKKPLNNMVLTTLNFPKKYKENLINLYGYGGTNFDSNFKTFYKGDKYNYEIDINFKNKQNKLIAIEEEEDSHKKAKSYPKQVNYNNAKVKSNEIEFNPNDYFKVPIKTKKTTEKPKIMVYEGNSKNSPNKYPLNSLNKNVMGTMGMPATTFNFNLPNITMKNFKIKK
jgi:serine/threonine protein kinase